MAQERRHCGGRFAARLPPTPGISSRRLATGVFFCLRRMAQGRQASCRRIRRPVFRPQSPRVTQKTDAPRASLIAARSRVLARRSSPVAGSRLYTGTRAEISSATRSSDSTAPALAATCTGTSRASACAAASYKATGSCRPDALARVTTQHTRRRVRRRGSDGCRLAHRRRTDGFTREGKPRRRAASRFSGDFDAPAQGAAISGPRRTLHHWLS